MPTITCPLCKSGELALVLDLGFHPLADTFLKKEELLEPEMRYPLQVLLCKNCGHAMSSYSVPPSVRYQEHEYSYDSSNSKVSIEHFAEMAKEVTAKAKLIKDSLVVDIGGNVGTLLQAFQKESGTHILNVEPSPNIAALAMKNGVPTINGFFDASVGRQIADNGGASAITITNAFNHISGLDEFMRAVVESLRPDGVFVIEAPYLLHLVQKLAFDTVYLEHVSYFAVKPLRQYFAKFGFRIVDLYENDYMGGSVRLYVSRGAESPKVAGAVAKEEAVQLFDASAYTVFAGRVAQFKFDLLSQLIAAKKAGGRIIGIGAATKGNTLMNYCSIDATLLEFVTDASPLKVGKYTPGSHIPILPDEAITQDITHALILPWNIAEFLKGKLAPKYPSIDFIVPHM